MYIAIVCLMFLEHGCVMAYVRVNRNSVFFYFPRVFILFFIFLFYLWAHPLALRIMNLYDVAAAREKYAATRHPSYMKKMKFYPEK